MTISLSPLGNRREPTFLLCRPFKATLAPYDGAIYVRVAMAQTSTKLLAKLSASGDLITARAPEFPFLLRHVSQFPRLAKALAGGRKQYAIAGAVGHRSAWTEPNFTKGKNGGFRHEFLFQCISDRPARGALQ